MDKLIHKFWAYPSSYVIIVVWGTAGFGYQPGISTFLLHFVLMPVVLLIALAIAHWEGRNEARKELGHNR